MAKPIRETPILDGEHAKRFDKEIKANENRKVSGEHYNRAQRKFKKFKVEL